MSETKQHYVTYRRVSTKDQGKIGLGLEAQDRDISIFLETYSEAPWEVVGEFVEVSSGSHDERPELSKAIELAKKERATLLVAKLDRLSRRVSKIAGLMEDPKLKLKVASMPAADKFQLHIYAALAEQERDFISKRTKAALAEAKVRRERDGLPGLGGIRDATMARNAAAKARAEARAQSVAGIVQPLSEAGRSLREIATELGRAGVSTPRGGSWQASQVKRVIDRLERAVEQARENPDQKHRVIR